MTNILDTGIKNSRNVDRYIFGFGALKHLNHLISERRKNDSGRIIFFVDSYFKETVVLDQTGYDELLDLAIFIDTSECLIQSDDES